MSLHSRPKWINSAQAFTLTGFVWSNQVCVHMAVCEDVLGEADDGGGTDP